MNRRLFNLVKKLGEIPFEDLKIGDEVIDILGVHGRIAALYPSGTKDPFGVDHRCFGGGILFIWNSDKESDRDRFVSIAGHAHLGFEYVGGGPPKFHVTPIPPYVPQTPPRWVESCGFRPN